MQLIRSAVTATVCRRGPNCSLTTRQYPRLLSYWLASVGGGPASVRYALTVSNEGYPDLSAHRQLAGRSALVGSHKIESIVRYLGIEVDDALATAEQVDV